MSAVKNKTYFICSKDLYNSGRCFTKGKVYDYDGVLASSSSLLEKKLTNDLGEQHIIGSWWRNFKKIE